MRLKFDDDDCPVLALNGQEYPISGGNVGRSGFYLESGEDISCLVTEVEIEAIKASISLSQAEDERILRSAEFAQSQQQADVDAALAWNANLSNWVRHYNAGGGKAASRASSDGMGSRGGGTIGPSEWWEHPSLGSRSVEPKPMIVPVVDDLAVLVAQKRDTALHNAALAQAFAQLWLSENQGSVPDEVWALSPNARPEA